MRDIFTTEKFRRDLDGLDKPIKERAGKTIRQIATNPDHSGLDTKKQFTIRNRTIWRSRVNKKYRLLWEWANDGIRLWHVGNHDDMDAIHSISNAASLDQKFVYRDEKTQAAVEVPLNRPQPFKNIPDNVLRLFGVPDDQLDDVRNLTDPETLWDKAIPKTVKSTLIDILTHPEGLIDSLVDTRQLLYRTTVDQLEGYCEGKIKRLLLNLTDEQMEYVHIKATGPILIKGVAGSGKTTIGLYRANYLAERIEKQRQMFGENAAILLLTYTKTLAKALHQLYEELYGELSYAITISTYDSWMLEQLQRNGIWLSAATQDQRRYDLIKQAQNEVAREYPKDKIISRRPLNFLLDEIDKVIRARGLTKLDAYRSVNRVGRGRTLQERHRALVWAIYGRYQQELNRQKLFDWADLPRLVQKHCPSLPQYDVVIIDEAQDLPPSDLHLAAKLIPDYSESRSLTLLADPAQSIYYRGIPWKEAGINISGGRTRILAKNFRNTKQVMESARPVLDGCQDLKDQGEYIPPASIDRKGTKPLLVQYKNTADEWNYILKEVIMLCRLGKYRLGDVAIIARTIKPLKELQKRFKDENIPCNFFRDGFDILENQVKLITMHSAKGLEFPIVFIINLDNDVMPHIHRYSETKYEDELQERKLFYVSMTRAAERLYLLYPKHNRCRFLHDVLDSGTVNAVSAGD